MSGKTTTLSKRVSGKTKLACIYVGKPSLAVDVVVYDGTLSACRFSDCGYPPLRLLWGKQLCWVAIIICLICLFVCGGWSGVAGHTNPKNTIPDT